MPSHATVAEACPIGRALGPMPIGCMDTPSNGRFTQVPSSSHQLLWPRALSEVRLHEEPAVTFGCDFSFDVITPYLPSVVQGAIDRWRDDSLLPGCDSQKASDVARTQFDRAVGTDASDSIRLGKITIVNPETPLVGADESYSLNISSGLLSIAAPSPWGVMHALTSLGQLLNTTAHPATILPMVVTDAPTYKHRGLMLDPARNFLPVGLLQKVIRGLSLLKLNVLHLDLINAPSFPFVAPSHPEFAEHGSYPGMNYTAADLQALVGYGARYGVLVLLEVDTPGHSFSWGLARPELTTCDKLEHQRGKNCPEPPCGYMDMKSKAALNATIDVISDVMDLYGGTDFERLLGKHVPVHLGADEVSDWCFGEEHTKPLFRKWVGGLKEATAARKRPTVTWMESWSAMGAPLTPADSTLQFWGNAGLWPDRDALEEQRAQMQSALDAGFPVLYSNASEWYLDCGAGNFLNGDTSWCDPYKSWQVVLAGDPRRHVAEAQQHLVVGGEICLWGEQTDPQNLEQKLWQRAAAVSERLWAPAEALAGCQMPVDLPLSGCWKTAQDRLRTLEVRLRAAGFGIAPSQPLYCTLAPDMCDAYH
jgi:hexosaminidase